MSCIISLIPFASLLNKMLHLKSLCGELFLACLIINYFAHFFSYYYLVWHLTSKYFSIEYFYANLLTWTFKGSMAQSMVSNFTKLAHSFYVYCAQKYDSSLWDFLALCPPYFDVDLLFFSTLPVLLHLDSTHSSFSSVWGPILDGSPG